jgi:hypothetical protein
MLFRAEFQDRCEVGFIGGLDVDISRATDAQGCAPGQWLIETNPGAS